MSDISGNNYKRVFGHSGPKIDYSEQFIDNKSMEFKQQRITLIDDNGKPVNRVTSFHKNKIYRQAKKLREKLHSELPTKSEHWNPTQENIHKVLNRELKNPQIESFKMAMKVIGADPQDYNIEKIRRGR